MTLPTSTALAGAALAASLGFAAQALAAQNPVEFPIPTGDPTPYRQTAVAVCDVQRCVASFAKVKPNRLLQIDNLTCITIQDADISFQVFFLSKLISNDPADIVAAIPAQVLPDGGNVILVANESGPYLFGAGERPLLAAPPSAEDGTTCTLTGKIFPTD